MLFVFAFGSAVGAGAAAGGVCAGAVVGAVGRRRRLSALPVLALAAVVHVGVAPWVLPDTGRGAGAVRTVLRATVTVWRDTCPAHSCDYNYFHCISLITNTDFTVYFILNPVFKTC